MKVVPVTDYDWKIADGKLAIDRDAIENTHAIRRRVLNVERAAKHSDVVEERGA